VPKADVYVFLAKKYETNMLALAFSIKFFFLKDI